MFKHVNEEENGSKNYTSLTTFLKKPNRQTKEGAEEAEVVTDTHKIVPNVTKHDREDIQNLSPVQMTENSNDDKIVDLEHFSDVFDDLDSIDDEIPDLLLNDIGSKNVSSIQQIEHHSQSIENQNFDHDNAKSEEKCIEANSLSGMDTESIVAEINNSNEYSTESIENVSLDSKDNWENRQCEEMSTKNENQINKLELVPDSKITYIQKLLSDVQTQLEALSDLPSNIQSTLDVVYKQFAAITHIVLGESRNIPTDSLILEKKDEFKNDDETSAEITSMQNESIPKNDSLTNSTDASDTIIEEKTPNEGLTKHHIEGDNKELCTMVYFKVIVKISDYNLQMKNRFWLAIARVRLILLSLSDIFGQLVSGW